jgi:hypothetical protein
MKMKKTQITLIALCAALMIPLGCKKNFLEQTNTFQSTAGATFQKSQDVVALVNSIYDGYQNSDLLKKSIWYYANFTSHDWFNDGGDIAWNNYTISPTFNALYVFWSNAYIDIVRANSALEIIATAKANGVVTPELGDRLLGEAYFLRGMTYYYLAGSFGGVPLELKASTEGLTPRNTQDEVFAQVIVDMKHAETLLQSKTTLPATEKGRATKGAAYGFEGAAQMWLGKYAEALAAFNNPELTNNYHLLPNFVDVHEFSNQNNDESLFEIQFDIQGSQSWDGGWQNGGEVAWIDDFSWPHEISGFGYSYQAGDIRKLATIVGPGDALVSKDIIAKWGGIKGYAVVQAGFASGHKENSTQAYPSFAGDDGKIINTCGALRQPWYGDDLTRSGYYCAKKWRDPNLTGANGTSAIFGSQNQILLRYAEVLLSRAECKIRTGDAPGALADIKLVRDRAFGGNAPSVMKDGFVIKDPSDPTKYKVQFNDVTDPMQMVLSEYRHELSGDYSLFYNLRRAGKAPSGQTYAQDFIHNNYGTDATLSPQPYPYGPTADGNLHGVWRTSLPNGRDILPIPQQAIGLNPNLKQNPGY